MRRIVILLLCVLFSLSVTSCNSTPKKIKESTVATTAPAISRKDAEKYALQGELLGVPLKLHASRSDIEKMYPVSPTGQISTDKTEINAPGNDVFLQINEGKRLTQFIAGSCHYYYLTGAGVNGVSIIVNMGDSFKLPSGATQTEVILALGSPDSSDVPNGEELFFLFETPDNVKRLTYIFKDRRIDFILINDNLSATVLTDTKLYNDFSAITAK